MNYDISKVETGAGEVRHQLRVWNYGPKRQEFKRRFETVKQLFEELENLRTEEERLNADPAAVKAAELTFGDLRSDWKARKANTFSPAWNKVVDGFWQELRPRLEGVHPSSVDSDFLRTIEQDILKRGNSQRTANIKIGNIIAILNFAVEMGRIKENPAARFKKTKAVEQAIHFWEREDAEDFLNFAAQKYHRGTKDRWKFVAYMIGINCALRAGEIWALKPRCIKRSLNLIHIDEQFDRVSKTFRTPKGKGPRHVPLNESVARELEELISMGRVGRQDCIFTNESGGPIDHDNFYDRVFVKDLEAWKGPVIDFHGLRHTGATLMLMSGVDLKTVSAILGHKDIKTTARYLHLISGSIRAVADEFSVSAKGRPKMEIVRPSSSEVV